MKKQIDVVTIDTGIPAPETSRTRWPIASLEVGESFLFPVDKRPSVQSAASKVKRDSDRDFVVKKMDTVNCRIWRTK